MKNLITLFAATMLLATACTTQYQARATYDDLYYSPNDAVALEQSKTTAKPVKSQDRFTDNQQTQYTDQQSYTNDDSVNSGEAEYYQDGTYDYSANDQYTDPGTGNTYITNNYNSDDYYDYAYAARLRRFHSNVYYDSYYSPYYTNSYWYDYNPYSFGNSIYMGYNWWYPSYGMSWGYPYYNRYSPWDSYYGWGNPYGYGYGYGYGNYWSGYHHGGMDITQAVDTITTAMTIIQPTTVTATQV